jgi:hypothetical protein
LDSAVSSWLGFFDLDQGLSRLWFVSQPVSSVRIHLIAIGSVARIPIQTEFLAGTGLGSESGAPTMLDSDCPSSGESKAIGLVVIN